MLQLASAFHLPFSFFLCIRRLLAFATTYSYSSYTASPTASPSISCQLRAIVCCDRSNPPGMCGAALRFPRVHRVCACALAVFVFLSRPMARSILR
ncbi:hypothetical protein V8C43DRAFT_296923 [Trichoderma afarasin]